MNTKPDKQAGHSGRYWIVAGLVFVVFMVLLKVAAPEPDPLRSDALLLMNAGLWPLGVAAYCHKEVVANPALIDAAEQWNKRHHIYFERIVAVIKATGDMSQQKKADLDRAAYRKVKNTVTSQKDKASYCAQHMQALGEGKFDLDKDPSTAEALQHVMTAKLD